MKKMFLTMLFAAFVLLNYAQENNPLPPTAGELFSKAKKQKTAAWICVGAGATLTLIGVIVGTHNAEGDLVSLITWEQPHHNYGAANALLVVGGVTALTSIPLFVASTKNANKARLMVTNQKTAFGVPKGVSKNITGLTLSISL